MMKKVEMLYRKFFNVPDTVTSGIVYARMVMWIVLTFLLGIVLGSLISFLTDRFS